MNHYIATFLPEGISDHCPMTVSLLNALPKVNKPFQYCNAWSNHPQFLEIVKSVWGVQLEGCRMLQAVWKMKALKRKLKELNVQYFRNVIAENEENRKVLFHAKKFLQLNLQDPLLQQEEMIKYQAFRKTSYLAEIFWQQWSKVDWIKLGEDNTK